MRSSVRSDSIRDQAAVALGVLRRHPGGQVVGRRDPAGGHLRADAAGLDHDHLYAQRCDLAAERAEEVDFEDPAPLLHRQGLDRAVHLDAGVVDERVECARAGVRRGAPYRRFTGKDSLLTAVATESPATDRLRAAGRFQAEFMAIVNDLVGERNARHYGALLLTSAHGITDMELTGRLGEDSLHATSEELVDTLVRMVTGAGETT